MAVHENSIEAHESNIADGTVTSGHSRVLASLAKLKSATMRELVDDTDIPINTMSGFCTQLKNLGAIEVKCKVKCKVSGKRVSVLVIKDAK